MLSLALLPVVWFWGFWGFAACTVLQVSVMAAVLHCMRPMRVPCSFDFSVLRSLLALGFPLFLASYLFQVANSAERSALLSRGTEKLVGLYAPAVAVQTAMLMLPNSLLVYLYPKLSFKFGKTADPRGLWAGTLKATCGAVAISVLLAVAGWFALPWLLPRIFPAYRDSVPAMQWALISGIFLAVRPASAVFPALMAWRFHYLWVGVFVVAKWAFAFAFVRHVDPLAGVAFGGMLAALLSAIAILCCAYRATHGAAGPVVASVDEPVS
jgi:O-antigen/teichoic acid export membrane protein